MKHIINHSWQVSNGFKTHTCIHCGLVRYWDDSFKKIMYKTRWKIFFFGLPPCKRTMHCDKTEPQTVNNYKQIRHI